LEERIQPEGRGLAFVKGFDNDDLTLDVEYSVTGQESQEVVPERITASSLATIARCRYPNEVTRTSLLVSVAHDPKRIAGSALNPASTTAAAPKGISAKLLAATKWTSHQNKPHPLLATLRNGKQKSEVVWSQNLGHIF
jgi:hypothetical protein